MHDDTGKLHVSLKLVGGCDVSYFPDGRAIGCIAVLEYPSLEVVHWQASQPVDLSEAPYVPGRLAEREAPILFDLISQLPEKYRPELLFVDGNGTLHPRRYGLACRVGELARIPTIGAFTVHEYLI